MPTFESEACSPCDVLLVDRVDVLLVDRVKALISQEKSKAYATKNYLRDLNVQDIREPVNESCRAKMVKWVSMLCDMCHLSRSVVTITFSYVDRMLSDATSNEETISVLQNRDKYQLMVIVSFYIAVKINEEKVLSPDILERLSRGRYTVRDIETEEQRILQVLDWRLFGPNAFHFVHHLFDVISPAHLASAANGNPPPAIDEIARRALVQVEASLAEHSFLDYSYSDIALAALRNAIDDIGHLYCPLQVWAANLEVCDILVGVDAHSEEVECIKDHLREIIVDCPGQSRKPPSICRDGNVPMASKAKEEEDKENTMAATTKPPIIKKREMSSPTCVGRITIES